MLHPFWHSSAENERGEPPKGTLLGIGKDSHDIHHFLFHTLRRYSEAHDVAIWTGRAWSGAQRWKRRQAHRVANPTSIPVQLEWQAERSMECWRSGRGYGQVMVQGLDATVEEHVIVSRRPHIGSLTVIQFGVHVDVDMLVTRQLLH